MIFTHRNYFCFAAENIVEACCYRPCRLSELREFVETTCAVSTPEIRLR